MAAYSILKLSELEGAKRIDGEFYQPKYLHVRYAVTKVDFVKLGEVVERCKKGIFDIKAEKYGSSGVPFIRISNLRDGLIDDSDMVFLPDDVNESEKKTEFHRNDILLSKTAYPAASVIFFKKCNISQDIIGVSLKNSWKSKLRASYIVGFLNSKYGLLEMQQWFQGNIQMHLALPDVKRVIIPVLPDRIQQEVSDTYSQAETQYKKSKTLYSQAENLLLEELGLNNFKPKYELSYSANLSKAFVAGRVDAEYFQPAYEQLINHVSARGAHTIRQIQTFNGRGVQPMYVEDGDIKVVTSKNLGRDSINYWSLDNTTRQEWDKHKDARIRKFDILIYTTGAYVGRTNCYLQDDKALASNHVNILRVTGINPLFVGVYVNSVLGQVQVKRCVSGSAQAELYPLDISKFVVWNAPERVQIKIASLVHQSYEARRNAKELLKEAKRKVEEEIEKEAN